jgi:AraC-like DNA-binding protein
MMLTTTNFEIILYALPIYQLLFFTIQLVSFKKTNPSRKYFGLLLLLMTLFLVINALYYSGKISLMLWLYYIFVPLLLALPPLFYLYFVSLIKKENRISRFGGYVLFIPTILILLFNIFTFGFQPQKLMFLNGEQTIIGNFLQTGDIQLVVLWYGIALFLAMQLGLAIMKTVKLLKIEQAVIQKEPSHLAYLHSQWVYIISVSLLVFIITAAIQLFVINTHSVASAIVFNLVFLFSSGIAGFFGIKQDNLFTNVERIETIRLSTGETEWNPQVSNHKVEKKIVSDDEVVEIIRKIEMHLLNEKPYLDKRFTINDLSRQTGLSRNKLTFVINEVLEKNFYSLINEYRLREALEIIKTYGKKLTLDAVADRSGFHSRSSFYACFKKYTGQTPKEYFANLKQVNRPVENSNA